MIVGKEKFKDFEINTVESVETLRGQVTSLSTMYP